MRTGSWRALSKAAGAGRKQDRDSEAHRGAGNGEEKNHGEDECVEDRPGPIEDSLHGQVLAS